MTSRTQKVIWIIGSVLLVCLIGAVWFYIVNRPRAPKSITVTGVVLAADPDPKKQVPVPNAHITASVDKQNVAAQSDPSGLFHLSFSVPAEVEQPSISVSLQAEGYQPLLLSNVAADGPLVIHLLPQTGASAQNNLRGTVSTIVKNSVSVRYTTKLTTTTNVGALAETFEAKNTGGLPCGGGPVCSPDGNWRATTSSAVFEATNGNQFLNARISCIAGPCPFTRLEANNLDSPGPRIRVSVLNWSDTATFLVEAEVSRMIYGDVVRQSLPAIFGPALSFTLPPGGQGPSIQAELNGTSIVFPLGPDHLLSWATCTAQTEGGGTQAFRCELKPGYQFR